MSIAQHIPSGRCHTCGRKIAYWTPARIVHAIHAWERTHGVPPRPSDWYRSGGKEHPSVALVKDVFGSFLAALKAADVRPGYYVQRWTRNRIRNAFRLWALTHNGNPPRARDWQGSQGFQFPSYATVRDYFGGWQEALADAGFPTTRFLRCGGCGCLRATERTKGCRTCTTRSYRNRRKPAPAAHVATRNGGRQTRKKVAA